MTYVESDIVRHLNILVLLGTFSVLVHSVKYHNDKRYTSVGSHMGFCSMGNYNTNWYFFVFREVSKLQCCKSFSWFSTKTQKSVFSRSGVACLHFFHEKPFW
jgi:hypothetical protein